jgi:DNA-binding NarL/FixJ family response regulator
VIRVLVVENETLVRQGLVNLLQLAPDIQVAGEAADGEEALRILPDARADVVLLDLRMPRLHGIGVLQRLEELGISTPCLVLTTFDDGQSALDAIRAGTKGYLRKDVTLDQLVTAIRTLAAGGSFIQPALTEQLLRRTRNSGPLEGPPPLTEREFQVLRLMASGFSNWEIAYALRTAEGTVKNQVSSILAKIRVRDRTLAVLKALEEGWL